MIREGVGTGAPQAYKCGKIAIFRQLFALYWRKNILIAVIFGMVQYTLSKCSRSLAKFGSEHHPAKFRCSNLNICGDMAIFKLQKINNGSPLSRIFKNHTLLSHWGSQWAGASNFFLIYWTIGLFVLCLPRSINEKYLDLVVIIVVQRSAGISNTLVKICEFQCHAILLKKAIVRPLLRVISG